MEQIKVKIKDIKTGAIKEVKKSLVGDFLGTGDFVIAVDEKDEKDEKQPKSFVNEK